jgi:hypothetical protein
VVVGWLTVMVESARVELVLVVPWLEIGGVVLWRRKADGLWEMFWGWLGVWDGVEVGGPNDDKCGLVPHRLCRGPSAVVHDGWSKPLEQRKRGWGCWEVNHKADENMMGNE